MANRIEGPIHPTFFATPADLRAWLEAQHATSGELWIGFYKKGTGQPSITWPEAVDEVLCYGWIDGVRKRIDDVSYMIRFTPRKLRSTWSTVNIKRVEELTRVGRMRLAGLQAFAERSAAKSGIYAHEQKQAIALEAAYEAEFRANQPAWDFFQAQSAGYRRTAIWWIISAQQVATRLKRLAILIDDSAHGRTVAPLTRRTKPN